MNRNRENNKDSCRGPYCKGGRCLPLALKHNVFYNVFIVHDKINSVGGKSADV